MLRAVPFLVAHVAREFEHQLVEFDRRGAELADDDPGGGVGEPHRLRERIPDGGGQSQNGDNRIAGPGHVEYLLRAGRLEMHRARRLDQRHAFFRAGREHGLDTAVAQHLASRRRRSRHRSHVGSCAASASSRWFGVMQVAPR